MLRPHLWITQTSDAGTAPTAVCTPHFNNHASCMGFHFHSSRAAVELSPVLIGLLRQVVWVTSMSLKSVGSVIWGLSEETKRDALPTRQDKCGGAQAAPPRVDGWEQRAVSVWTWTSVNSLRLINQMIRVHLLHLLAPTRSGGEHWLFTRGYKLWNQLFFPLHKAVRGIQGLLHRYSWHRLARWAPQCRSAFLFVCAPLRLEPWVVRWAPRIRLPRRDPRWLTKTSERTGRRRPGRWNCSY